MVRFNPFNLPKDIQNPPNIQVLTTNRRRHLAGDDNAPRRDRRFPRRRFLCAWKSPPALGSFVLQGLHTY